MHAVVLEQDKKMDSVFSFPSVGASKLQNFEIYIGNSEDYSENKKCPGGPHMRVDDPSSYT